MVVSYNFQGISDTALAGLQAELNAAAGPSTLQRLFQPAGRAVMPEYAVATAKAAAGFLRGCSSSRPG